MNDFTIKSRGFTLVETMIAVTIVTLSVAGPLYGASRAFVAAEISRDHLIASYLASEGIEYVREMRDDEYLAAREASGPNVSDNAWKYFLNGGGPNPSATILSCRTALTYCTLDPFAPMGMGTGPNYSLQTCSSCTTTPLYLSSAGTYTQQTSSGTKTVFTRTIQAVSVPGAPVDALGNPIDVRIVSTVTWAFQGTFYTVTTTDHLTPWQ